MLLGLPGDFETVKEAQARADFEVLAKRDRRALRVDLAADATDGLHALHAAIQRALP